MADRIRMNTLALSFTALSQTPSFWHAGADLLRSKSLDRNSYNSGDWFNTLDWTGRDNGFGHGLPPAADNEAKWDVPAGRCWPTLRSSRGRPRCAQATAQAQDLLRLRFSTPLFRLGRGRPDQAEGDVPGLRHRRTRTTGVIVMRIDDTVGRRRRPGLRGALVVFNATPTAVDPEGLRGWPAARSRCRRCRRRRDPVVKTTTWDRGDRHGTVPARTVAVLVQR